MGYKRSESYSFYFHSEKEYKTKTCQDIHNILRNSDIHRKTGILHSDEPAGKTVKAEHGRSPPDADTKVESGQTFYFVGSLYESKCGFLDGILQSHQTECDKQSHAD